MTRNTNLLGVAFLAILIFAAGSAAGQDSKIALFNGTTHQLVICFHMGSDPGALGRPIKCYEIASNETRYAELVEKEFSIRVYRPGSRLLEHLYTHVKLANIYEEITFGAKQASFKIRTKPPNAVSYILKVCNQTSPDPVYFVLSFDDGKALYTRGWWNIAQNNCLEFPVSRMMNEDWKVPYGTLPRTHYYAYARPFGAKAKIWEGGEDDLQDCIQITKAFKSAFPLGSIADGSSKCPDNNITRKVRMRRIPDPKATDQYYYLTF
jgi:uncharacterized membrane protein